MNEDEQIKNAYRRYMSGPLSSEQMKEEKKYFIETHFSASSNPFFSPVILAPAVSLLVLLIGILIYPRPVTEPPAVMPSREIATVVESEAYEVHPVDVKRASSRVGTVMVYQKLYEDNPMTIVWVFPNPGG